MIRYRIILSILLIFTLISIPGSPVRAQGANDIRLSGIPMKFSLENLEYRTFRYFWDQADSVSGLIPGQWPVSSYADIAATGFGLSAFIDGADQDFITRKEAAGQVLKTLQFLSKLPQGPGRAGFAGYQGFFYGFLDLRSGLRAENAELSTLSTGILMAGVLSCLQYFDGDAPEEYEIRTLADNLYRRVDWAWALNGKEAISRGWSPESGFSDSSWQGYNESMIMMILATGSPTHPVPASCWSKWTSGNQWAVWYGQEYVSCGPLRGHQWSHAWIDFRNIQDAYMKEKGIDYFENSRRATLAQQEYAAANPGKFAGYGRGVWGLTACDGPGKVKGMWKGREVEFEGFSSRGTAAGYSVDDGTLSPSAAGGSLPFAPEICIPALESMFNNWAFKFYGPYGFRDAFNPSFTQGKGNEKGWFSPNYSGINEGLIVLMIANNRNGLIRELMKKNRYITEGLKKAGFSGGWLSGK